MKWLFGGSTKGFLPVLPGSMGEQTAVASAKRGVRGDFSDGTLSDGAPAEESSEDARGREETETVLEGFSEAKSDIA